MSQDSIPLTLEMKTWVLSSTPSHMHPHAHTHAQSCPASVPRGSWTRDVVLTDASAPRWWHRARGNCPFQGRSCHSQSGISGEAEEWQKSGQSMLLLEWLQPEQIYGQKHPSEPVRHEASRWRLNNRIHELIKVYFQFYSVQCVSTGYVPVVCYVPSHNLTSFSQQLYEWILLSSPFFKDIKWLV